MSADGRRRSRLRRLYHGQTEIDFVGRAKLWFALSGAVIALGLVSMLGRGLDLGIEFEGGTSWVVPGSVATDDVREVMSSLGAADASVQTLGGEGGERVRVQAAPDSVADREEVSRALAELAGTDPSEVQVTEVSPSWGSEITSKAQRALVFFLIAIALYITLRFEWRMALATLAALVHDILVTVGIYSLAGLEVTPATVIAVLTILGYSIYDGIVVFDKVDENVQGLGGAGRSTYSSIVNRSLNQVLMRTVNTSITALLPIASLLVVGSFVLGAVTLQEFALALLIGLGASAYSSIFIASPLLALIKEREPRWASTRRRLESRSAPLVPTGGSRGLSPSGGEGRSSGGSAGEGDGRKPVPAPPSASPPSPPSSSTGPIAPRGRKKGKRR
ncbi:MAG: protein translocase subunit SecF [Actinomycetota bacterium]|nr:protein translocase subunit SecF [Actinomycetota bacterium]